MWITGALVVRWSNGKPLNYVYLQLEQLVKFILCKNLIAHCCDCVFDRWAYLQIRMFSDKNQQTGEVHNFEKCERLLLFCRLLLRTSGLPRTFEFQLVNSQRHRAVHYLLGIRLNNLYSLAMIHRNTLNHWKKNSYSMRRVETQNCIWSEQFRYLLKRWNCLIIVELVSPFFPFCPGKEMTI